MFRKCFLIAAVSFALPVLCWSQRSQVVLQNGLKGYTGCEDQLLIKDDKTAGYCSGHDNPEQKNVAVCYYKC